MKECGGDVRIGLCILTWNELGGCQADIPDIPTDAFDEIFAVDGGSTDGTVQYLEDYGIRVLQQPVPTLNAACKFAFQQATTDALVFFHPKGTVPPQDLRKFRSFFEDGYELVIASRNLKEALNEEDQHLIKPRKWFVRSIGLLIAIVWWREGNFLGDVLHGFRGMTNHAFQRVGLAPTGSTVDVEMVVASYRLRMKRVEFPTREAPRRFGETHFAAFPTGVRILKYLFRELFRHRRDDR